MRWIQLIVSCLIFAVGLLILFVDKLTGPTGVKSDRMNIHVVGVTASWCDKCKRAKEYLKDYDIHWLEYENMEDQTDFNFGQFLLEYFDVKNMPFFTVIEEDEGDGIFKCEPIYSMLKVKRLCEEIQNK